MKSCVDSGKMDMKESINDPSVELQEYVDSLPDNRQREWIGLRFSGYTLAEIGERYGKSTGRVQLTISSFLRTHPPFKEDIYRNIFERYEFTLDSFVKILQEKNSTFFYLSSAYHKGSEKLSNLCMDASVPPDIRKNARKYIEGKEAGTGKMNNGGLGRTTRRPGRYISKNAKLYKKVVKRIKSQFDKKFYIGDIAVSDDEYAELLGYVRAQTSKAGAAGRYSNDSPVLAVALVQIGIRRYDGNYWANASEELKIQLSQTQQRFLGESFIKTLKNHNKYLLHETERVHSIMLHTFVSDYYSRGLFELLFQYYKNDLERDINRNDAVQMQALMDTLIKKAEQTDGVETLSAQFSGAGSAGSRAYKLRHHTLNAISANPTHSRTRLRRLIRLIDRAFWKEIVPTNPTSRLTILFEQWVEESASFHREYELYKAGEIRNRGKKHFSSPYLFADLLNDSFKIKLPGQIIGEEYADSPEWIVRTKQREIIVQTQTYQVVTGCKTENEEAQIAEDELLGEFECLLTGSDTVVKRFSNLPSCSARLFDMDGDYASRLFKIPMCAFTRAGEELSSAALTDKRRLDALTRWDMDLEDGDIVILPNQSSMIVGERYCDGLVPRGRARYTSYCDDLHENVTVYSEIPSLLLTIPKTKLNGTALEVNGGRHRLGDCEYRDFDNLDSKGERAFLVPLAQFRSELQQALNQVMLDVPGNTSVRSYPFVWVQGFTAEFDGMPYVFQERGTVTFPENIEVRCAGQGTEKIAGENSYKFTFNSSQPKLPIEVGLKHLPLRLDIPMFIWSTNGADWHIEPMGEVWHSAFPTQIYIVSPSSKIEISTDSDEQDDEDAEQHSIILEHRQDGPYLADLTRFKSWLTRDRVAYGITLRIAGKEYDFATVYVRSYVASCQISADFEKGKLSCKADVIGKAQYFLDVKCLNTDTFIAEKAIIIGDGVELDCPCASGKYQIRIYEAEEDESGFEEPDYNEIYYAEETIINKDDLSGKCLNVRKFRPIRSSILYTQFGEDYWITGLQKTKLGIYSGRLTVGGRDMGLNIGIKFPDYDNLRYFCLYFWDDYEENFEDFMFDSSMGRLVQNEKEDLDSREKYRRYKMLYDTDYIYYGVLFDEIPEQIKDKNKVPIEVLGLSIRATSCLKSANYNYLGEIQNLTLEDLIKTRNMGSKSADEVLLAIKQYKDSKERHLIHT